MNTYVTLDLPHARSVPGVELCVTEGCTSRTSTVICANCALRILLTMEWMMGRLC